jgi:ubiquinol-cytochrome c reductase cytochrome b subunit
MRILKTNPVLTIINSYLIDSPQPSTISYLWNFGSLLGLCLVSQIVSGIILAMHYQGSASFAFASVEHIMRECAHVLFVKSVLSNTLVILVYDIFIIMTTIKCHDYGQFNKRIEWIATWKEVTKSLP